MRGTLIAHRSLCTCLSTLLALIVARVACTYADLKPDPFIRFTSPLSSCHDVGEKVRCAVVSLRRVFPPTARWNGTNSSELTVTAQSVGSVCIGQDDFGSIRSVPIRICLGKVVPPGVSAVQPVVYGMKLQPVVLSCFVEVNTTTAWLLNGKLVISSQFNRIANTTDTSGRPTANLHLDRASKEAEGYYQCVSARKEESSSAAILFKLETSSLQSDPLKPTAPDITVSVQSYSKIEIVWDASSDIFIYIARLTSQYGHKLEEQHTVLRPGQQILIISNLTPFTEYHVWLEAIRQDAEFARSQLYNVTTFSFISGFPFSRERYSAVKPCDATMTAVNSSAVMVVWRPLQLWLIGSKPVRKWQLWLRAPGVGMYDYTVVPLPTLPSRFLNNERKINYTIGSLLPNTTYLALVVEESEAGYPTPGVGEYIASSWLRAFTLPANYIGVNQVNQTALNVSWYWETAPTSDAELTLTDVSSGKTSRLLVRATRQSAVFSDVVPDMRYNVSLKASGSSSVGLSREFSSAPDLSPLTLGVASKDYSRIALRWHGDIQHTWAIRYAPIFNGQQLDCTRSFCERTLSLVPRVVLSGLLENQLYGVDVVADPLDTSWRALAMKLRSQVTARTEKRDSYAAHHLVQTGQGSERGVVLFSWSPPHLGSPKSFQLRYWREGDSQVFNVKSTESSVTICGLTAGASYSARVIAYPSELIEETQNAGISSQSITFLAPSCGSSLVCECPASGWHLTNEQWFGLLCGAVIAAVFLSVTITVLIMHRPVNSGSRIKSNRRHWSVMMPLMQTATRLPQEPLRVSVGGQTGSDSGNVSLAGVSPPQVAPNARLP